MSKLPENFSLTVYRSLQRAFSFTEIDTKTRLQRLSKNTHMSKIAENYRHDMKQRLQRFYSEEKIF